jgi:methionyl-tRNA synthetase
VQRATSLAHRLCGGRVPARCGDDADRAALRAALEGLPGRVDAAIARFSVDEAVGEVFGAVDAANRYLETAAPWRLARTDADRAALAVRASLDAVAALAGELSPFLPATGEAILQSLGADGDRRAAAIVPAAERSVIAPRPARRRPGPTGRSRGPRTSPPRTAPVP